MANASKNRGRQPRKRPGDKGVFTTKSGTTIKLRRNLLDRWRSHKDAKARRRAAYLSTLPKSKLKRFLYRLHPKRLARYWFSRDGALMALKITGVGIVVGFVLIVGLFAYFRKDLPNITDLHGKLGATVQYYDRTGQELLWEDTEAIKRTPVSGDKISDTIRHATLAIEDKNFYDHGAFDLRGILRAGVNDVFKPSEGLQGGSSISQQLVKLDQEWTADRTISRKIKELILAVELEREYSKDDILNGYLNLAPYGGTIVGVESAARSYFDIGAKDLTIEQAALLASIPKAPSLYSPYAALEYAENREALLGRQQYIIGLMAEQKLITKEQAEAAKEADILAQIKPRKSSNYANIRAPHFVLSAQKELEEKYGGETIRRSGWKVTTTVDLGLQSIAEEQVKKGLPQVQKQLGKQHAQDANVAFAAMDVTTGQMVALVGGVDFSNADFGELNYAQTPLPPGSSFKPYDYIAMIENTTNSGAGSVLYDTKDPLPGYPGTCGLGPKTKDSCPPGTAPFLYDYDQRFPGPLTLRYALGGSRNVPAVKAMLSAATGEIAAVNKTISTAEAMGLVSGYKCYDDEELTSEAQCYQSSAIGDGAYLRLDEHVNGFATMSRLGSYIPKTYILKIEDSKGKLVEEWQQPKGKQVIRPDSAYIVTDILSDPKASYMASKAQNYKGWKFALKTGTTNDSKDGWMMGTSAKYAAGVWVGHQKRQVPMSGFMETMTLPIWRGWMQGAHDKIDKPVNWEKPSGIKTLPAFVVTQHVGASSVEPSPSTDIYPSWYKPPSGSSASEKVIDIVSKKLATSCTPELAKRTEQGGNANLFSADKFKGGSDAQSSDTDDLHNCNDVKPSITLTAPSTCSGTTDCIFTVTVSQGTHSINSPEFPGTVKLLIDGQQVDSKNVDSSPSTVTFLYNPTESKTVTVEARIIDSALYSAADSKSVTLTAGGGGGPTPSP